MGQKLGGSAPLGEGELGFHVNSITVEPNAETQNWAHSAAAKNS